MACQISYKDRGLLLNNMQFARLIDFVIEVGRDSAGTESEKQYVARMVRLNEEEFWPGRGIRIEDDFPDVEEQKFWARVFLDTARAIFDRRVGCHEHAFWQAQSIHQAYGTGLLFSDAVRDRVGSWFPDTIDHREFDRVVNEKEST